ncbi:MAG: hypothetical protein R3E89_10845 [Thiolinea sp.]
MTTPNNASPPADEILADQVFQLLETGQQIVFIGDNDIAGHRNGCSF